MGTHIRACQTAIDAFLAYAARLESGIEVKGYARGSRATARIVLMNVPARRARAFILEHGVRRYAECVALTSGGWTNAFTEESTRESDWSDLDDAARVAGYGTYVDSDGWMHVTY